MATLYGAKLWQEAYGQGSPDYRYDIIGNNSEDFDTGDPVSINTTNELIVTTGTLAVVGVAVKDQTLASDNETVGLVTPAFIPSEDHVWLMGTNSDLTSNATDYGKYYKLTGASGLVQVDVSSGVQDDNDRHVMIVKVDPRGIGGTGSGSGVREVLVKFIKQLDRVDANIGSL